MACNVIANIDTKKVLKNSLKLGTFYFVLTDLHAIQNTNLFDILAWWCDLSIN